MSYLEPVEMEKPAEKRPRGQREALLVEGLEHDCLVRVLRWEFLPVVASPPGDLFLRVDAALHHVLDVALLERALLLGRRWWQSLSRDPRGRGRRRGRCGGHDDGGEAQARGGNHEEEESREFWKLAKSSGNSPSQQGGGKLWSAREQGDRSAPPPLFKYRRPHNGQIRNQRPDQIGPAISRWMKQGKR